MRSKTTSKPSTGLKPNDKMARAFKAAKREFTPPKPLPEQDSRAQRKARPPA